MKEKYKGIWPVMVTPFNERGGIDYDCYINLIDWYISQGVDGIFAVCGSSEMFALDESERLKLAEIAVQRCKGRIPVVATGSIGSDIESHKDYSVKLADIGVDAVILLLPDFCIDESSTLEYLFRMSELIPCDVGVYECPNVGISHLSVAGVESLAKSGRFGPYKETSCDVDVISSKVQASSGSGLSILQANTPFMLDAFDVGASGLMGISVNVVPWLAVDIYNGYFSSGRSSVESNHRQLCIVDALLRLCYPVSAKLMLSKLGFDISADTRLRDVSVSREVRKLIDEGFSYILEMSNCPLIGRGGC